MPPNASQRSTGRSPTGAAGKAAHSLCRLPRVRPSQWLPRRQFLQALQSQVPWRPSCQPNLLAQLPSGTSAATAEATELLPGPVHPSVRPSTATHVSCWCPPGLVPVQAQNNHCSHQNTARRAVTAAAKAGAAVLKNKGLPAGPWTPEKEEAASHLALALVLALAQAPASRGHCKARQE